MAEERDLLCRYVRLLEDLGEPELFFPRGERADVLRRVGRAGSGQPAGPLASAGDQLKAAPAGTADSAPRTAPGKGRGPTVPIPDPVPLDSETKRLAAEAEAQELLALPDLAVLRAVANSCTRCTLHRTRAKVVFADGSATARVVCVGEAPGQREDETGLPFVGPAGMLLDRLLLSVGFSRQEVFICNVLKCRPPRNRNPLPDEIERCSPFLLRQVEILDPEVIIAFGTFAAQTLLESRESLGRLRGRTHLYRGYPLVATYHPAALLRNPGWTRPTWEDLQLVRRIADGDEPRPEAGKTVTPPRSRRNESASAPGADVGAGENDENLQLSFGEDDG